MDAEAMRKLETMRSFRLALIGLFIVAGAVGCAEADPWVGEWREVAVEASGHDLFRTMVLERDKNGALVGSIESESRTLSDGRPVAQFWFRFDEVTELDSKLRLRLRYVDESKDRITITLSPVRKKRLLEGRQTLGGLNRERPIRFRWNAPGRLEKQTRTFQRCGGTTLLGATRVEGAALISSTDATTQSCGGGGCWFWHGLTPLVLGRYRGISRNRKRG